MDMRVVSWNVWWRFGGAWQVRERLLIATLARLGPDVVALQEVWRLASRSQADVIGDALGMDAAFAAPSLPPVPDPPECPDQRDVELGVAILSRWPILQRRVHRLPARHRRRPVALMVTLDHPLGPLHVWCACTEWEPHFADDHLAQTRALAELVGDPHLDGSLPVLLAGDLNAPPESDEIRALTDVMVDTWTAGGGTPGAVTLDSAHPQAPVGATKQIDRRIDYVLARPGRPDRPVDVRSVRTAGQPVDGLYPSDHLAVVADLGLP